MRVYSVFVALAFAACSNVTADPKATGPQTTEVRKVDAFHGLSLTSVLDVDVTIGPATKLEVRGPKDWVARLVTKVENGVLVAKIPGTSNDQPEIKLVITTPDLTSIDISGVVALRAAKLATKNLDVTVSGVGTVDLAGRADTLRVTSSGVGEIRAKDLVASSVSASLSGAGSVAVQAKKEVEATLSGAGDLTIYGNPASVKKQLSGVGEIRMR